MPLFCFAQEAEQKEQSQFEAVHYVSFMPYISCASGIQEEYVFLGQSDTDTDQIKLSALDWQQTPLVKLGVKVQSLFKYVYAVLNVQNGVTGYTGYVYDWDWLNRQIDTSDDTITNFSQSYCTLRAAYNADLDLGVNIPLWHFVISPYGGASYSYSKFYAIDGYAFYGSYDSNTSTYYSFDSQNASSYTFYGNVLSLERNVLFTWAGLNIDFKPLDFLSLSVNAAFSPYCYIDSIDSHLFTGVYYRDIMSGAFKAFRIAIESEVNIKQNSLVFAWNFLNSSTITGPDYYAYSNTSKTEWTLDTTVYAGCSFYSNTFYVGYKIKI